MRRKQRRRDSQDVEHHNFRFVWQTNLVWILPYVAWLSLAKMCWIGRQDAASTGAAVVLKTHTHLDDAFETIAEFMAQTTYQCKNVYESDYCSEPSDIERAHMSRFHHHTATGMLRPTKKHAHRSASEDFHIEVTPGTYTITAGMADSQQQSRLINLNAGETIKLTFDL